MASDSPVPRWSRRNTLNLAQACFIHPSSSMGLGDSNPGPPVGGVLNDHRLKDLDGVRVGLTPWDFAQACFIHPSSSLGLGDSIPGPAGRQ